MNKFLALTLSAFFYSVILCAHTEKCDAENATFDGKVDAKQLVFPEVSFVDMAAKVGSYIEFTLYITTDAGAQDVVRRDGEAGGSYHQQRLARLLGAQGKACTAKVMVKS
jgi:hypothetical protein